MNKFDSRINEGINFTESNQKDLKYHDYTCHEGKISITHSHTLTNTHTHSHTHTLTHTHKNTHTHTHTHKHTQTCRHTYACTYTLTNTHTHTHTPSTLKTSKRVHCTFQTIQIFHQAYKLSSIILNSVFHNPISCINSIVKKK